MFILIHVLLILGYVRHVFNLIQQEEIERWSWVIYPLGLGIIALTHYGTSIFMDVASPPDDPVMS